MKTQPIINAAFVAAMLLSAAPGALAAADSASHGGASSVADMLQNRQDAKLREQFVLAGRWDDVRKMDAAKERQHQTRRDHAYAGMNADMAHNKSAIGAPIDTRALDCEDDPRHVR